MDKKEDGKGKKQKISAAPSGKALIIDIPFDRLKGLSDEERCTYKYNGVQCHRGRAYQGTYCDVHRDWDYTMLSTEGIPVPESPESLQAFLMKMLNIVYRNTSKTPQQLATIQTIVKLLAKNAHYL
jgi:hypothetical protein